MKAHHEVRINLQVYIRKQLMIAIAILGVAFHAECSAQDSNEQLTRMLRELCEKHNVPALAVSVVDVRNPMQTACYGIRKRNESSEVELSDRFPIGSCTKSMTATLAAVVVESGKIDWKSTIGDVWPETADLHVHPLLRSVTLDELLSHQSGLPSDLDTDQAWRTFFDEAESPQQERRRMLKLILNGKPVHSRSKFSYSNLGYVVVAAMLETRAGQSYESLMRQHVFGPLKMPSADFRTLESARQLHSPTLWGHKAEDGQPSDPRNKGAENPSVYSACGTVQLSIEDYARYAQWHMLGKPEPVLRTQASFDHLHTPRVNFTTPNAQYACGWICLDTGLGPALNHGGSNTNFFALTWLFPKAGFAVVICTNTGQKKAFHACDEVASRIIKHYEGIRKSNQ